MHLLWLVWQVVMLRKRNLVMGADSLSPRPEDLRSLAGHTKAISSVAFSPDEKTATVRPTPSSVK